MARRARGSSPQPTVNNSAASKNLRSDYSKSGRTAPGPSRSSVSGRAKVSQSLPADLEAPVKKSERIVAHEAPSIRSTRNRAQVLRQPKEPMKTWTESRFYAGLDWAKDHHDVVVVDPQGTIVADFRFAHTLEGWKQFQEKIAPFMPLAVVLETSQGMAVDQLMAAHCLVFALHAKSAQRYRDRKIPSGNKTDRSDAWALAEALRTDGSQWAPLQPGDPLAEQIRLLCRDEMSLIQQRTLLVNQLQQALYEYYPVVLEAFEDWTMESAWDFVIEFPTPQALQKAGRRRWEKFLHAHHLWRQKTAEERLAIFARATEFCGAPTTLEAKSLLALSLAKLLRTLQAQLNQYRQRIQQLSEQHPHHDLFDSLPGAGATLAPRLLGSLGAQPDRFENHQALQCLAGTAPVSYQSGQIHKVHLRYQCDKFLRQTVHLWSDCSRKTCTWAQVYYQKKRAEGKSHACALRCLGQRWLKILWKMWQTKTPYNPELHAANQQKHGSWVLTLMPQKQTACSGE